VEKEKNIENGWDINDMNGEPKVRHSMSVLAVVKDENGEERSGFKRYCGKQREGRK